LKQNEYFLIPCDIGSNLDTVTMATMAMETEVRPKIFISGRDPRPAYRHPLHTNKAFEYFNIMRK